MSNHEITKIGTALSDTIRSLRNAGDSLKQFGISLSESDSHYDWDYNRSNEPPSSTPKIGSEE